MAERLPVGSVRSSKPSSYASFSSSPASSDISAAAIDRLSSPMTSHELDSNGLSNLMPSNGPAPAAKSNTSHNRLGHSEVARNGSRTEGEANPEAEWVEQDEPGVYITLTSLPGGVKDLKRVRFRYVFAICGPFSFSLWCLFILK